MKKLIVVMALGLGFLLGGQAFAADSSKLAVVNVGEILHSSKQVQAASKALQDKYAARQKTLKSDESALQDMVAKLKKDGAVMKPEDKKKLQSDIEAKRKQLLDSIAAFQKSLSTEQSDNMKAIFDDLNNVIEKIAKQNHIDLVLDSQFVIYNADQLDLTKQVQDAFSKTTLSINKDKK